MRIPILPITAALAAIAGIANGVDAAVGFGESVVPSTRLGTQVAGELAQQRRSSAQRDRALDLREQALKAAQQRMARQAKEAATPPAPTGSPTPSPDDKRYEDLARIFQAMKPARAAPVFEKLTPAVQLQVARRMRERSAALIMSAMSPESAAALGMALADGTVPSARTAVPPARTAATARPAPTPRGGMPAGTR